MKNLKEFKKIFVYAKDDKWRFFVAVILIVTSSFLGIIYGYLNGAALEAITNLDIKRSVALSVLYFIGSLLAFTTLGEISKLMFKKIEINMTKKLMSKVYEKVLNLPTIAFEKKTSGELINRITNDTASISETVLTLLDMIIDIFGSLLILLYIIHNSLIVFGEIVLCMIILFIISHRFSSRLKKNDEAVKSINDEYTSAVTESIRGIRDIKTLGIKNNIFTDLEKLIKNLFKLKQTQIKDDIKYEVYTDIIRTIMEVGVFITCAFLVYYQKSTITFYVSMTYYVYRYVRIVDNLANFNKNYQRVLVSVIRVNELVENRLFNDEEFGNKDIAKIKGIIEFKNVTFGYKDEEAILNNFNLKLTSNQKIAIVGKSGQGKSTIFNLITKIFNTRGGQILIDGININELSEKSLRDSIAIIRQEPFIFNRTIKENFRMINPRITLSEIRQYTKQAYLDDYIMSLPKKYDTLIGEGGTNLSGGQKQRLAIARALAKKSKIILFDEATSALDNESQGYIGATIDNLVKDHTVVIIAHRLSTIKDADIIHVIDEGQVQISGTHDELLQKAKAYQDLYNKELA